MSLITLIKENAAVDALSRVCGLVTGLEGFQKIHKELRHPGTMRMTHVARSRNLLYSFKGIKRITKSCQICAENKPRFYKPPPATLIKATQPFKRPHLDIKSPLPSKTENKYMLTIIDEYS